MIRLMVCTASLFPYDPRIDSRIGHLHLILIYGAVWVTHLGYAGFLAYKWRAFIKERASAKFAE